MAKANHFRLGKDAPDAIGNDAVDDPLTERDRRDIARIRGSFHALYEHPLVSRKTKNEYENMLDDLEARGEVGMMRENIGYLKAMIDEAEGYKAVFRQELDSALKNKWINQSSHDKWWARFNDGNTLEWHRKEWIASKFPDYLKGWKDAAAERDKALKLAAERGLRSSDIPELAAILDLDAFLTLDFHARKGKAHAACAAIGAHETGRMRFFALLKKRLSDAASGSHRYLHPSKVGVWLKRVMESGEPEHFATETLEPFLENWKNARERFDQLQDRLKRETPPRGLPPVNVSKFLLWTYDQRISYIDEANARLDHALREKTDATRERDFLIKSIREDMGSRDWEGAELLLHRAQRLYASDPELPVLERYLTAHRDDLRAAQEKVSPQREAEEALRSLRAIVPQIHGSVRHLYELGLCGGSRAFSKVMKVMHARVAHRTKGKAAQTDVEEEQVALEMRSIDRDVAVIDDALNDDADRPALYMDNDPDGQKAAYSVIQSRAAATDAAQSDEHSPRLIPAGLTLELQTHLVHDINPAIIQYLRQLERAGMSFTQQGPTLSRN